MVLGLTAEAYVVYKCEGQANPEVVAINGSLLFFVSFNSAKQAAEDYLAILANDNVAPPQYLWIEPISKLWINGVS